MKLAAASAVAIPMIAVAAEADPELAFVAARREACAKFVEASDAETLDDERCKELGRADKALAELLETPPTTLAGARCCRAAGGVRRWLQPGGVPCDATALAALRLKPIVPHMSKGGFGPPLLQRAL
jgi:hypothetical protein